MRFKGEQGRKITFASIVVVLLCAAFGASGATNLWNFSDTNDYVFDGGSLEVTGGYAQLKTDLTSWYSDSWTKRKAVTVTGSTDGALSNYQVLVTIPWDADMQTDFDDIRFTDASGTTSLAHYLEAKENSTEADFWVNIPSIPASPSTTTIYAYYGNALVASASDSQTTFIAGTDFTQDDGFTFRESGVDESYGDQTGAFRHGNFGIGERWEQKLLQSGGRTEPIAYLGNGVVLVGVRAPNAGHIFKSSDYGVTWEDIGVVTGGSTTNYGITNIQSAGGGVAYLTTFDAYLWKTVDYGETWESLGKISNNSIPLPYALTYGLQITDTGTILLADTRGHIFRSEDDGETWSDSGVLSGVGFYRFQVVGDGILLNEWNGHIFKSIDDGLSWEDLGSITGGSSALYATEYLGDGIVLQGSETGFVYRSIDNGETWSNLGDFGGGADDFAYLGDGVVVYTTDSDFTIFISSDFGVTWNEQQTIQTGVSLDWMDHVIYVDDGDHQFGIGTTNKGYIMRTEAGATLQKMWLGRQTDSQARLQLDSTVNSNFAVRAKVNVFLVGIDAWYPIFAISTTGTRACSTNDNYALSVVHRYNVGLGLTEFKGADQNPCYVPNTSGTLNPVSTSFGTPYIVEIRKPTTTSATIAVFNEAGTLLGSNTIASTNKNYAYLMAQLQTPAGWSTTVTSHNVDFIFLRSYTSSEPTYAIGSETSIPYISTSPSIEPLTGTPFTSLSGFDESASLDGGSIVYKISNDGGATWYWYNSGWETTAGDHTEANSAGTIDTNIGTFPVGDGDFMWRAYLDSDGTQFVRLNEITLTYTLDVEPTTYALTASTAGTGTGTVTSNPAGIDCGVDCTEDYDENTDVTVSQSADPGSVFVGWSGACSGTGACVVTMSSIQSVTATFDVGEVDPDPQTLTLAKDGTGLGTVSSAPAGIDCGVDCAEDYAADTEVTLTASATAGSDFIGWSGSGCSGTGTCIVTMSSAQNVTATFDLEEVVPDSETLTVSKEGTGSGTVTSSPSGIDCGDDCTEDYAADTVVTLSVVAADGSNFIGWSGGGCSGAGACEVTMNTAQNVVATFDVEEVEPDPDPDPEEEVVPDDEDEDTQRASHRRTVPRSIGVESQSGTLSNLLERLQTLLAELRAQGGSVPPQAFQYMNEGVPSPFLTDLEMYDVGDDVVALQKFLIAHNAGPAALALSALGPTGYFGPLTYDAVIEFQKTEYITPVSGFFGPVTRARANALLEI
jgi:hypothetical protein